MLDYLDYRCEGCSKERSHEYLISILLFGCADFGQNASVTFYSAGCIGRLRLIKDPQHKLLADGETAFGITANAAL